MFKFFVIFLISLSFYERVASKIMPKYVCEEVFGGNKILRLSVTKYIDVKHAVFECDGQRAVYIEGAANASTSSTAKDPLRFHRRCGNNVEILDDGRVAQKVSNHGFFDTQVFTNRPLRNNEIFLVSLENSSLASSIGIGVVTESPDTVDILDNMLKSPVAFILFHGSVFTNGKMVHDNYGSDLTNLQEGGTAGVMRTKNGTLHFFLNGVDQGPAVTNIPSPVYGFVDIFDGARKVSIID